jgi:plastocyanin
MLRSLACAAVLLAALAAPAAADPPVLYGTVGPGSYVTISSQDFYTGAAGWQPLAQPVDAGTYDLRVQDNSSGHNFHLVGPGIDQSTTVAQTGTFDWTLNLAPGTYTFFCDPHVEMRGTFTVQAPKAATPPTTTTTTTTTTQPAPKAKPKPTPVKPKPKAKPKKKKKG